MPNMTKLFKILLTRIVSRILILSITLTVLFTTPLKSEKNTPLPLNNNIIQVETQWITRYNGKGNNLDQVTAITLDD